MVKSVKQTEKQTRTTYIALEQLLLPMGCHELSGVCARRDLTDDMLLK
jgi:hypothetical protein